MAFGYTCMIFLNFGKIAFKLAQQRVAGKAVSSVSKKISQTIPKTSHIIIPIKLIYGNSSDFIAPKCLENINKDELSISSTAF